MHRAPSRSSWTTSHFPLLVALSLVFAHQSTRNMTISTPSGSQRRSIGSTQTRTGPPPLAGAVSPSRVQGTVNDRRPRGDPPRNAHRRLWAVQRVDRARWNAEYDSDHPARKRSPGGRSVLCNDWIGDTNFATNCTAMQAETLVTWRVDEGPSRPPRRASRAVSLLRLTRRTSPSE